MNRAEKLTMVREVINSFWELFDKLEGTPFSKDVCESMDGYDFIDGHSFKVDYDKITTLVRCDDKGNCMVCSHLCYNKPIKEISLVIKCTDDLDFCSFVV